MEQDFSLDMGIMSTEEIGSSQLFADDQDIKAIKKEEEKEKTTDFSFETQGSPLVDQEEEVETPKTPKEEAPKKEVETLPSKEEEEEAEETEDAEEPTGTVSFEALSEDLYNLGIFSSLDEDTKPSTAEDFQKKWEEEKHLAAQQTIHKFLSQFGKKHVDAFQAIYVEGVDPETYFQKTQNIEAVRELDIEDTDNQESIVRAYYKKIGWSDDKIRKKIEKLKDYDDLKEEAVTYQEFLAAEEEKALQQEAARVKYEYELKLQEEAFYRESIEKKLQEKVKMKEFDGIPLSDKVAHQVAESMLVKKWENSAGQQFSDFERFLMDLKKPENFDKAIKIALLAQNNFDFSKIKTKAVSEVTNQLFKSVHNKEKVAKRANPTNDKFSLTF